MQTEYCGMLFNRCENKIKSRCGIVEKFLGGLAIMVLTFSAMAEQHGLENADLHAAIKAFDAAYANNDIDTYFGFYADDATVYFYGARQDMAAYREEWAAMMEAGGGVEKNEMSDLQVQVMPCDCVAIATSFIDNRTRAADGTLTTAKAFETDVWQKIDGEWKIISLHYSEISPDQ
jgi:ketosteroid isomerase-like protein